MKSDRCSTRPIRSRTASALLVLLLATTPAWPAHAQTPDGEAVLKRVDANTDRPGGASASVQNGG